jgi:NAD(P)-dependent dehydrogenase (short-subunit alcohol dehydrogenase family)
VDPAAAAAMVERVEKEFGPIDILVNSAGAAKRTDADDLTPAAWRAGMDAKYFSYINVIDPLIKKMGKRGQGVVINVIGAGGKVASPTHPRRRRANAALMLATAGLAYAYASKNVRVIGPEPGRDQDRARRRRSEGRSEASQRFRRSRPTSRWSRACRWASPPSRKSSPTSWCSPLPSAGAT